MHGAHAMDGQQRERNPGVGLAIVQVLLIGSALALAALTQSLDRWDPAQLVMIVALSVVGDLHAVQVAPRLRVSGTDVGVMLAAVLLGPGPAVLVGLVAVSVGWFGDRERLPALMNNVANFAWFPLACGLFFQLVTRAAGLRSDEMPYYLVVFATSVLGLAVNFAIAAGYQCYMDGASLLAKAREGLMPVLSAHLFSAVLEMAGVYIAVQTGTTGIVLVGLTLVVFQYLIGELLKSKSRGEELQRLATTDTLTGLISRDHFNAKLDKLIADARPAGLSFAVMLIDLDRFKEINDTLGHHYGDELLRELGPRLLASAGRDGLVARLGGDEFAVLPAVMDADAPTLERMASKLVADIQDAIIVDDLALEVGASIGIARFPVDGANANTLLRCADVAMYAAKETHTGWKFYASELDRHSVRKLSVISDFRRALQNDELVVYYQPIVDVAGSGVRGAEALVRWDHPKLGLLAPGAFVDTVEQTGLIGPMTRLVLEQAVDQCAEWRRAGQRLSVAVNLSVRNLLDRNLPSEIDRMLTTYGLPPEALQLEITESMLMSDPERVLATVIRLNALGVRLSVDDFGTGYSSLANLRQMPIDELKIDRSFVSP